MREDVAVSTDDPTQTQDPAAVERALRAGLDDFELSDEDRSLLDAEGLLDDDGQVRGPVPVVAIVGRPNVGKSTLVNRILGRREAVVEDVPGVTRDRVAYDAEWTGHRFTVVDTGGWEPDARGIARCGSPSRPRSPSSSPTPSCSSSTPPSARPTTDEAVVKMLRRSGKPVVLVANKVDDQRTEADAAALWNLGLGEPWPVSALHGRGSGDVLDALLEALPEVSQVSEYQPGGPRRVALLGRPNVGKSSLLNKLTGTDRVVVDDVAGTTRDPVDELVELGGRTWRFVDTAGIRRRVHQTPRCRLLRLAAHPDGASRRPRSPSSSSTRASRIAEQDVRVIQQVIDAGRALVIAFNKWDLIDEERRHYLEREIERDLVQVPWAPRVNVSARTGRHLERLVPAIDRALESLGDPDLHRAAQRVPRRGSSRATRTRCAAASSPASSSPPRRAPARRRFVLFTTGFIEAGYRRFIERRLREEFGFEGTPIEISVRVREKRSARR